MTKFWMCYAENGGAPTMQHSTYESARREAERLARQLGRRVYVLEAQEVCELNDVKWAILLHPHVHDIGQVRGGASHSMSPDPV